jgi:MarR family transcriptional regulator, organic hydroperoxide resistance regulator
MMSQPGGTTAPPVHQPGLRQQGLMALIRTADAVRRHFERLLEPHDLTLQQFNVLRILRGARPEALPTMEIAARMIEQAPGITRLLDRLDEKGFVRRVRCEEDRRQVLCSITDEGLALLEQLDAPVREADERVMSALDDAELGVLIRMLDRTRDRAG